VFSFFLVAKILESKHNLDLDEFKFFISPIVSEAAEPSAEGEVKDTENTTYPCSSWLDENQWLKLVALSKLS